MRRATLFAGAILAAAPARADPPPRDLVFDVYRDGQPIGSHAIDFARRGDELEVAVDINLQVKLLFVPVYRYEHRNREVWRDGRLARIETWTDDNGSEFFVKGVAKADGFEIESTEGSFLAPADVVPTSWWRFDTVERGRLLNSQRGELMSIDVTPEGEELIETAAGLIPARRYVVDGEASLELWYDRDDRLAKIRFAGSDGSSIEYRRRD